MSGEFSAGALVELVVPENHAGSRLDWFLAQQLPQYSRVHLRRAINAVGVKVEGHRAKASHRLRVGEHVSMVLPDLPRVGPVPENIPLEILFEDAEIAAVNKPPGMVVHPAKGHWEGTLTSALAFHFEHLSSAGGPTRPGIVHRLDRDTSGVLVVAKTDATHMRLSEQFEQRTTEKEYFAIVVGVPDRDRDLIDLPIGPHPSHREKMAIRRGRPDSRESQTFYEVIERFDGFAALKVLPKTGRTHQIRLHLSHIGFPVLCDRLYGGRARITRGELSRDPSDATVVLERQALHARRLKIISPTTGQPLEFVAPLPADLEGTLSELRQNRPR
ncbi:MAG TPA: RluA family pseudouridine synthase [Pirellulales bacterium]|jgi:23S rRNA pseudouridine1911/1915/1917 synthase